MANGTTEKRLCVLLVDDDEEEFVITRGLLSRLSLRTPSRIESPIDLHWVETYDAACRAFENGHYDAYLVDYKLGQHSGIELLEAAAVRGCHAPIILLTGQGSYEVDLAAMQAGAADYLDKSQIDPNSLERSIRYAIERSQAQEALRRAHAQLAALHTAAAALLQTIDLETLLSQILDAAQVALPSAESGIVHLFMPDTGNLQARAVLDSNGPSVLDSGTVSIDPRIKRYRLSEKDHWLFKAIQERKPVLVPDVLRPSGATLFNPGSEDWTDQEWPSSRSIIIAPLVLNDSILGTLSLGSAKPLAFSHADLNLLSSFAITATAAIRNAMLHAEVQRQAITDPLTNLYNRRGFFEIGERDFERFQRSGTPLSAILLDIDYFKQINDELGHAAGDKVLQLLAERLTMQVRKVDVVGRYGGDEFVILLPESDLFAARDVAERLRLSLERVPLLPENSQRGITISLGVAQALPAAPYLNSLLERADQALYIAKQSGRNRVQTA